MPVIVIAPYDRVFDKTVANMQEVAARGGRLILVTDAEGAKAAAGQPLMTLILPDGPATVAPLVYAVPVQLIAYHTAVIMGTDVGQPRNLVGDGGIDRLDLTASRIQQVEASAPRKWPTVTRL